MPVRPIFRNDDAGRNDNAEIAVRIHAQEGLVPFSFEQ